MKLLSHRTRSTLLANTPWWLLAIIGLGVVGVWHILTNHNYQKVFSLLSNGLWTTIWVSLIAFSIAITLGLLIALAGFSRFRVVREFSRFYIELIRGIPILVLLFYIAFVAAPELVELYNWLLQKPINNQWLDKARTRDFNMMYRAIFALCISYSAFLAEIFRAGIQEVDKGQIEAAKALGLKRLHCFRFIIFPQAFRKILPPLGNDFVAIIKDSALVSALGVQDITQLGKIYSASSFQFFETYNVVAFLYLSLTITLSLIVRGIEHYLNRNHKPSL